jgi:transcriptional regulator with XRE-family HTH domain
LGITQDELGRLTRTDRTRVSKVESGEFNMTLGTLTQFAAALELATSELVRLAEGTTVKAKLTRTASRKDRVT